MSNAKLPYCSGMALGEGEDDYPCPLRENCKHYNESDNGTEWKMFYTMAFGCDDYEPINEDIE